MTRVKRGTISLKRRRNILKLAKGFRFGRSTKEKQAKEALYHAGNHAFNDRRKKKNNFRQLWQTQIGAAVKEEGLSYSKFIDALKKKNIGLNRKMLAHLAEHEADTFKKIVAKVK
jgi:large subunit ribosomal protein L20